MRAFLTSFAAVALLAAPVAAQNLVNLRDADIRAFIDDVSKATGTSFVIDSRVQGKVSVVTDKPLSRAAYFELFLATLRANGFVAVPLGGGQYRVQPAEAGAASAQAGGNRFVTSVVPLASIDAASAAESVRPLLSRGGAVSANRGGNALIIVDFADNVARARSALAAIDRDRATMRVVPLTHSGARDLAASLTTLVGAGEGGRPPVTVAAIDASNAIALRGEAGAVARYAAMVGELDRRAASGSDVRVLFLKHADAAMVLPVLQTLIGQTPTPVASSAAASGGSGNAGGNSGGNGGGGMANAAAMASFATPQTLPASAVGVAAGPEGRRATVTRFEGANALVISAPTDIQRQLGEVVRQLDVVRPQVQVEAIIVEISDTAARQLGVQFLLSGTNGSNVPFAAANYSNAAPNILALAGAVAAEKGAIQSPTIAEAFRNAAVNSLLGPAAPTGGTAGFAGNLGGGAVFGFIINAVRNDGASNILSTPSVMTLDNQPARILVGQEIPITTGEALGTTLTNAFRTVSRQDVGIQLAVRPQINEGGIIKLDIKQIVSSISGAVSGNSTDLILNKREIETAVTVEDGQIVALGGLLDDNERRSIQRVPLLGDIPVVGELFKSRSRSRTKTNLMVFIRPTIVRSRADADAVAANRWDSVRDAQVAREGFSGLDALARDYLRTTPPAEPAMAPK